MLKIQEERQNLIVNHLKSKQFMRTSELVDILNYSEATIKRDLRTLEQKGLVRRTRGGAFIVDREKIDIPYLMKLDNFDGEKNKSVMADLAMQLVMDDMVLFIDSSSTSLHMINKLAKFEGLSIITNGVLTAALLNEYTSATVSILGGNIVSKRFTINGSKTYEDALTYNADIAFISCRGFSLTSGATEVTEGEATMKHAYRKQSELLVLLATSDKFDHKFMHQSLSLNDINYLITDKQPSEEDAEILDRANIEVMY